MFVNAGVLRDSSVDQQQRGILETTLFTGAPYRGDERLHNSDVYRGIVILTNTEEFVASHSTTCAPDIVRWQS